MFGLFDWRGKFPLEEMVSTEPQVIDRSKENEDTWFCFLPAIAYDKSFLRNSVLPSNNASRIIFKLPFPSIVINPREIRKYFDKIYGQALSAYENMNGSVSVLGVSLGNAPAFKFANAVDCERLLSVVPGESIFDGIEHGSATKHIYQSGLEKGYTSEDFKSALDEYNPGNNISNLPENIEIHLGKWDNIVPYRHGKRLVTKIRKSGKVPIVTTRKFLGHVATIARVRNKY
jgi:hypothetical protein